MARTVVVVGGELHECSKRCQMVVILNSSLSLNLFQMFVAKERDNKPRANQIQELRAGRFSSQVCFFL